MNWGKVAGEPWLVLPVYLCVIFPLLLYVYHDILDKRWRHVADMFFFLVCYTVLYVVAGTGILFYIVIQVGGQDYKEVGASLLTILIGSYEATKLVRLARILMKHRELVQILNRMDRTLADVAGVEPLGLPYKLVTNYSSQIPEEKSRYSGELDTDDSQRHLMLSTTIFDDDFPGDAMRVRWLHLPFFCNSRIEVVDDDAEAAAARIGLWIRLALRRPSSEPWRLATSSSPLVTGHLYRASLGTSLRRLAEYGVDPEVRPPCHFERNPVEALLNRRPSKEVGVGFFWTAAYMSGEEVSQALAEMHPRWLRSVTQNGKNLMWETSMSFILVDFPKEEQSQEMQSLLSLPVLSWQSDITRPEVWENIASVVADAVSELFPVADIPKVRSLEERHVHFGKSVSLDENGRVVSQPTLASSPIDSSMYGGSPGTLSRRGVREVVRNGILALKEAKEELFGFQGETIGLTLLELIRASARSGFIAEEVLGPDFFHYIPGVKDQEEARGLLCNADIVTGVVSILIQLGLDRCPPVQAKLTSWKRKWGLDDKVNDIIQALLERAKQKGSLPLNMDPEDKSAYWLLGQETGRCSHPLFAFSALVKAGRRLSGCVYDILDSYISRRPAVLLKHGPNNFRNNWLRFKFKQAGELSRHGKVLVDNINSTSMRIRRSNESSFLRRSSADPPPQNANGDDAV